MLLDNLNGLEYEKQYLFGKSSSTFINTNQIIINEGITMVREGVAYLPVGAKTYSYLVFTLSPAKGDFLLGCNSTLSTATCTEQ